MGQLFAQNAGRSLSVSNCGAGIINPSYYLKLVEIGGIIEIIEIGKDPQCPS